MQQQQQQLMHQMQQQPTGAFNTTSSITTDHIQQYLDENKALILNILENQNTGKFTECAENQTRLQHNLMYLAAIADSQPKQTPIQLQPYMNTIQHQQLQTQHMVPQSHMMAQSVAPFSQQPQFMQHALQSQLGVGLTGPGGTSMEGESSRVFPDISQLVFGDSSQGVSKQASRSTAKENRTSGGSVDGDNPQKKGKLSSAAA
ncbi:GRF-interacting factor 1-like [Rutidosis leptorrhynchoides]|uniref:GRF-interacting factor 1-like n=1 Tax=Rutidosis leptorrhynchoides TaxID=125765 RepID=UPI003A99A17B